MIHQQILKAGPNNSLLNEYGEQVSLPSGWVFLPAGNAAITRKVTSKGFYWRLQFKKGRRIISKGLWAPKEVVEEAISTVTQNRATESYQKKRSNDLRRRAKKHLEYEESFLQEVEKYLNFHPHYKKIEKQMALAITKHAIPVGSGSVARTAMIPIEERAAKASIAWMRHQTTTYDQLQIEKIKGERRTVRRKLAQQSVLLLNKYRNGENITSFCPLRNALLKFAEKF